MSRAEYCRQQAQLCRDMAALLSNPADVTRLSAMARNYEAEADRIGSATVEDRPELPPKAKH